MEQGDYAFLRFKETVTYDYLNEYPEPEMALTKITHEIYASEDIGDPIKVGQACFCALNRAFIRAVKSPLWEVFDAHSQDMVDFFELNAEHIESSLSTTNLWYLSSLEVVPEYRNIGIGSQYFEALIYNLQLRFHNGVDMYLLSSPIIGPHNENRQSPTFGATATRLDKWYKALGFNPISKNSEGFRYFSKRI